MRSEATGRFRPGFRLASVAVSAGMVLAVVAGFFGSLLPLFDTLAQFRAHLSVCLLVAAAVLFLTRARSSALVACAAALLGLSSAVPFLMPAPSPVSLPNGTPRYTLLQMNLRFDAPDRASALSRIAAARPDVVTLQEITPEWQADLERLRPAYPFQAYCLSVSGVGNTAILSRRPFIPDARSGSRPKEICDVANGFSARRIDFNGIAATVGSEHLRWPWPGRQGRMVDALAPTLAALGDPLIIAGDFNSAPWTATMRRYAANSRTRVLAGVGPSWIASVVPPRLARFAGLPIDNVFVSDGIDVLGVETLPATASDHLPVLVTFTLRFAVPEEPDVRSARR